MLLWPLSEREAAKPGRRGSQKFQLENAGLDEKARQGGEGPATIHHSFMLPFPKTTYLYLAPNVTPLKAVFLSEPKQDL